MAGDIKRIFDFGDVVLIHEAASMLNNNINAEMKKHHLVMVTEESARLVPTLDLLWTYLAGSNIAASRACGCLLTGLVRSSVVDGEYALHKLLNVASFAKCPSLLLEGLESLLIFLIFSEQRCRRFYPTNQHPLVRIYHTGTVPVADILSFADRLSNSVEISFILRPLALLVMTSDAKTQEGHLLLSWLCHLAEKGNVDANQLWNICEYMPSEVRNKFLVLLSNTSIPSDHFAEKLAIALLNESSDGCPYGLEQMEKAVSLIKTPALDAFSLIFSSKILQCPYNNWELALKISRSVCNRRCPLSCNLFFPALVNLNSIQNHLNTIGRTEDDVPRGLIQSCLSAINSATQENEPCSIHALNTDSSETLLSSLCKYPGTVLPFLRFLAGFRRPPNENALNLLCSLLVLNWNDDRISQSCCEAIVNDIEPCKVSLVLPAFVQVASRELASGGTTVMDYLPKLAVHHVCTPPILRFLLGLASAQRTRNHGYRLLAQLYKRQPFIYSGIKHLFGDVEKAETKEVGIMKMELLYAVCAESGGLHGGELAPMLTGVINNHGMGKCVTLAVAAAGELCMCEALNPEVVWRMLHGKLGKGNAVAICALCDFCGLIAEMLQEDEDPAAMNRILLFLWRVASSERETKSKTAALQALSKFDYRNIEMNQLGIEIAPSEEGSKNIPGDLVLKLLDSLEDESLDAFSLFLSKLIDAETETVGRVAHYNARVHASKEYASSSGLDEFCSSLASTYSKGALQPDNDLAVALLLTYEPPTDSNHRVGAKQVDSGGRHYLRLFEALLRQVPFEECDWKLSLLIPLGWIKFMDRMYSVVVSSRQSELETGRTSDRTALDTVSLWARDEIVDTLKTTWRQVGDARPNCCLALAALGMAVKQYSLSSPAVATADTAYAATRHWIIVAMETLLSFGQCLYAPRLTERIFETLAVLPNSVITNAARLGACMLLPFVQDDISDFYALSKHEDTGLRFFPELLDIKSNASDPLDVYAHLAGALHCGESVRQGAEAAYWHKSVSDQARSIGSWLGAVVYTILAEDDQFAEHLLRTLIGILENSGNRDTPEVGLDRDFAAYCIGLLIMTLYPDHNQFINSDLSFRLRGLLSKYAIPGFLARLIGPDAQYQGIVSARIRELNDSHSLSAPTADAFDWLCSCCGSDHVPFTYVGRSKKLDIHDRVILKDLCKLTKRMLSANDDYPDLQSRCFLNLATVAFATRYCQTTTDECTLPDDYSYLDKSSVLRHCVDYVQRVNGKKERIRCILDALTSCQCALPPVNWSHVINTVYAEIDCDLDGRLVKLAVKVRLPSLILRLTHPTTIRKLSRRAKETLLENVATVAVYLSPNGLKRTLGLLINLEDPEKECELTKATLKGFKAALTASQAERTERISVANRTLLINYLAQIALIISVDSYNDSRLPIVRDVISAALEIDEMEMEQLAKLLTADCPSLMAFSVRISILIRRKHGETMGFGIADKLVDAYARIEDSCKPSALRIMCHELAVGHQSPAEREAIVLHLMNGILALCKRDSSDQAVIKICNSLDVCKACIAAWYHGKASVPLYLWEATERDSRLTPQLDAIILNDVIFAQIASNWVECTLVNNQKLVEKIVEWAFQLLPAVGRFGVKNSVFVREVLRSCRSTDYYVDKLRDPGCVEKVLDDVLGD